MDGVLAALKAVRRAVVRFEGQYDQSRFPKLRGAMTWADLTAAWAALLSKNPLFFHREPHFVAAVLLLGEAGTRNETEKIKMYILIGELSFYYGKVVSPTSRFRRGSLNLNRPNPPK